MSGDHRVSTAYVLVAGNTRVGSTWLSASMHQLPQIHCTREIRWLMPYQEAPLPVHTYIEAGTTSMKERLDASCSDAWKPGLMVKGAKLKFDPYGFVPPEWFARLGNIVENDIRVIFLRRPYIEIFGTWKSFGIRQLANEDALARMQRDGDPIVEDERIRLDRFFSTSDAPLEMKNVVISSNGQIYGPEAQRYLNGVDSNNVICYPVEEAIDDHLVLFYNDLLTLSLQGHGLQLMSYADLADEFSRVLASLHIKISESASRQAMAKASTKRIEDINADLVHPSGALTAISNYLDMLFHQVRCGETTIEEVIRYDSDHETVSFLLPGLSDIFLAHEETRALQTSLKPMSPSQRRSFDVRTGRWTSGREIYQPLTAVGYSSRWTALTA